MSRILYLDTFSGISGDMFLGALVDAGLDVEQLKTGLSTLPLNGYRIETKKVFRGAFQATRLHVHLQTEPDSHKAPQKPAGKQTNPPQTHEHTHSHEASHSHDHGHSHSHAHHSSSEVQRGFREIVDLIEASGLSQSVQARAIDVFRLLGEAESRAHGVPIEKIHFHEVGAVDSIVDIVGGCLALDLLGIDEVWSSKITLGSGFARGAHGTFPLPAPATLEILEGVPIQQRDCSFELTTPTGAALARGFARGFGTMPPMTIETIGYGAGNDRPGEIPNLLRVVLGRGEPDAEKDRVILLETNVDDMSPQWLGHLMDKLLDAGALDVSITPIFMKKSRPAHKLSVIISPGTERPIEDLLFRETTTFGIRKQEIERLILSRRWVEVQTDWGIVRVKVGERDAQELSATPEYEDLRRVAETSGKSLKDVHRLVMRLYASSD